MYGYGRFNVASYVPRLAEQEPRTFNRVCFPAVRTMRRGGSQSADMWAMPGLSGAPPYFVFILVFGVPTCRS